MRIDRPPANALDPALLYEAHAVLDELRAAEPAAVVLTGGRGFFSAGLDLKLVPTLDTEAQGAMVGAINRLFAAWYALPFPVVCAVTGHAIAGGLILALCGDYRVGASEGRLGLTELRVGVPYPAVAMTVVKAELDPRSARRLTLGAQLHEPQAALGLGLLDEVVEPAAVLPRALEVAGELAASPPGVYAQVKRQLRAGAIGACAAIVDDDSDPMLVAWLGEETEASVGRVLGAD